jgi:AhpD family alkylhydroperoxidase
MLNNWTEQLSNTRRAAGALAKASPKLITGYQGLVGAQNGAGALDAKTRELIALAVAVTTRCDGCIASHANAARQAGVTEAELADALGTAIALNAGAAYVYSIRAMEALGQFEGESAKVG